jgi:hypothetical protein
LKQIVILDEQCILKANSILSDISKLKEQITNEVAQQVVELKEELLNNQQQRI